MDLPPTPLTARDGRLSEVDAAELVPGDVVVLRIGDIVSGEGGAFSTRGHAHT